MAQPRRRRIRPAVVRFYFDADVLGLAHVVAALREDATYPGDPGALIHKRHRPPCLITNTNTTDEVWIPQVARAGWVVITRDQNIKSRPAELQAVVDNAAKVFSITTDEVLGKWGQLEILMRCWREIERHAANPGPYVIPLNYSGLGQAVRLTP
jgi:hypothetical protein